MMGPSQSLPELVAVARVNAKTLEDRIVAAQAPAGGPEESAAQVEELREATVALEAQAVDIFTLFEARMQHHFKRGPFSRKLTALLLQSGQTDLAERVRQYYLVVNVLKHGKGASYRELLNAPGAKFAINTSQDSASDDGLTSLGLVDISFPGFFEGLTETILDASQFLEKH
ncbi:hypothetical protein [Phaeobacter porticola]|uniref:Uncharacterized protein n=1 Tax=Phaeobacter porticola TaxID=1844006 RepID=A0A1L3I1H2_9RHOB|nr:hypothetical protein [Phaeobacter porticola]APG45837.1 hypothetical protein PhaeoP97_00387 [Phaeobacter porticola]